MTKFKTLLESLKTNPKTWLITGNAGFIGSNLAEFLLAHNQKVIGLDNFSTGYQHNIDDVLTSVGKAAAKNFSFIQGDIANLKTCQQACKGVDIILHQAALGSVPQARSATSSFGRQPDSRRSSWAVFPRSTRATASHRPPRA